MKGKTGLILAVGFLVVMSGRSVITAETIQSQQTAEASLMGDGMSIVMERVKAIDETLNTKVEEDKITYYTDLKIQDLTGTQAGWRLDIKGEVSRVSDGNISEVIERIPSGSLKLIKIDKIKHFTTSELPRIIKKSGVVIDDGKITMSKAEMGEGKGEFQLKIPEEYIVLEGERSIESTYISTITWDLVQAP